MSEQDPLPMVETTVGDPNHARIMDIMARMLGAAALDQRTDDLDPKQHTALTIAAAGFAGGYLSGASIVVGSASEGDKRRMGEMMLTNFREGIKIGKAQALLAMSEQRGAGNA